MAKVTVGILTRNRLGSVRKAIASAYEQEYEGLEVVVVDADSNDGTADAIRREFPEARLIRLPHNLGCPGGRNHVFANATGEYIVNLDDDGYLGQDTVCRVVETFESDPHIGVVSIDLRFIGRDEGKKRTITERHDVGCFFGGCSAVRRSMIDRIGFFPADFFLFQEEAHLAIRALDAGYRIVHDPGAVIWHPAEGGSSGGRWDFFRFRNPLVIAICLFPAGLAARTLSARIVSYALVSLKRRTFHKFVFALGSVLIELPRLLRKRTPCSSEAVKRYFATRLTLPQRMHDSIERSAPKV